MSLSRSCYNLFWMRIKALTNDEIRSVPCESPSHLNSECRDSVVDPPSNGTYVIC